MWQRKDKCIYYYFCVFNLFKYISLSKLTSGLSFSGWYCFYCVSSSKLTTNSIQALKCLLCIYTSIFLTHDSVYGPFISPFTTFVIVVNVYIPHRVHILYMNSVIYLYLLLTTHRLDYTFLRYQTLIFLLIAVLNTQLPCESNKPTCTMSIIIS